MACQELQQRQLRPQHLHMYRSKQQAAQGRCDYPRDFRKFQSMVKLSAAAAAPPTFVQQDRSCQGMRLLATTAVSGIRAWMLCVYNCTAAVHQYMRQSKIGQGDKSL